MYWALLGHDGEGVDIGRISARLKVCLSGGAALPLEVLRGFEERFGVAILEGYGLSETSPVATSTGPIGPARRAPSVSRCGACACASSTRAAPMSPLVSPESF